MESHGNQTPTEVVETELRSCAVCGGYPRPTHAPRLATWKGRRYTFCSIWCAVRFEAAPESYESPSPCRISRDR